MATDTQSSITIMDFMFKYFAEIVTLLTILLGSQGLLYGAFKLVAGYIAKKRSIANRHVTQQHCDEHHDRLSGLLSEFKEMLTLVSNEVKLVRVDVTEATTRRVLEDGVKHKRDKMFAQATPFFKGNHDIRNFASMKLTRFVDFVLGNYNTMWTEDRGEGYKSFQQKIYALAQSVKDDGYGLAGEDYTNFFYNNYHSGSVEQYLKDVEIIFFDIVNNRSERFIDCSMSFAQKFLSEMVVAYMDWIKQSIDEEFNSLKSNKDKVV